MMLPAYLRQVEEAPYYYGSLHFNDNDNTWIINGEPCVIEISKRLFPGCNTRQKGQAVFYNSKRITADLNWLMLRYPLVIESTEEWARTYQGTIDHILRRDANILNPQKVTPPMVFTGNLREFQKEGLSFLLTNRRSLLADEMGLGKTVQALAFLASINEWPILLVVPPHLILHWKKKSLEFLQLPGKELSLFEFPENDEKNIHIIKGLTPYTLPEASIYIIHYLLLRGWKRQLPEVGFKTIIFDEIQELRHTGTEKYSSASLMAERCENVIGLSGTPIYNRGGEIHNVLNILEFNCLGNWDSFTREWCYGYGSDIVEKPELLGQHLKREGLLLRRTKAQVLQELPPKRRVIEPIDFDEGIYTGLIQGAIEKSHLLDDAKEYFERGHITQQIENETRMAIGIAKAPYVVAFVKMLLEAEEKILLFAHHHRVFDIYMDELRDYCPVRITGEENMVQKDLSVNKFANGYANIVIISLRAASGLDGLQGKASVVVFGELDWSPAVHSQAEDRAHRMGMGEKDSLLCYYLVCDEGTDQAIQSVLGLKVSQFMGIMGDTPETEEDKLLSQQKASQHMKAVIEKLKSKSLKSGR